MTIEIIRLTRYELISEIAEKLHNASKEDLLRISEHLFGIKLNPCGAANGTVFITNLDMVKHTPLVKYGQSQDQQVNEVIRKVMALPNLSIHQKRVRARLKMAEIGIYLPQAQFEQEFLKASEVRNV
ncbi:hypothetical protein VTH8203_01489 [Vibrio thalassae]|uniref:Uncharacterized protein n=1 Tax=Vibrio thalassae TaxID=1243014 RepID=A0A240EGT1_9VIBR|nr:hypothetical protein [Vibrio thalassae]SNX47874.1 hypothetical protein VTH8203_01489 [Vibrio thalassae]